MACEDFSLLWTAFIITGVSHPLKDDPCRVKKGHLFTEKEKETTNGGKEDELFKNININAMNTTLDQDVYIIMLYYIFYCAIIELWLDRLIFKYSLIHCQLTIWIIDLTSS